MSIKIFISYKTERQLIKSDILTPIQTGRAIADRAFEGMIGDDTGDNISSKNEMYNELSAQYWVWKNYDKIGCPDHVGFMHYRRHFIFNDKVYKRDFLGCVHFDKMDDDYFSEINLNDSDIKDFIDGYDLVCIKRLDLIQRAKILKTEQCKTPRGCYGYNRGLKVEDYDLMLKILTVLKPEYTHAARIYTEGDISFGYNSFIMSKELFFEYNEFLFPILYELEKQIDFSAYCKQGLRTLGYLGERLLSIFILQKMLKKEIKIKETPMSFLKNTTLPADLPKPIWDKECVVLSVSNYYAPYAFVAIKSLINKFNKDKKLDIYILTNDFSKQNKETFAKHFAGESISIRFFNVSLYQFPESIRLSERITENTYYRIIIPKIFKNYDRVLFLDADILVLHDVSELLSMDISDKKLGMALDSTMQCFCNDNSRNDVNYLKNELELEDPFRYYNAGIILFNLKRLNDADVDDVMALLSEQPYIYFDQDPINKYFKASIQEIPLKWNFTPVTKEEAIYKFMPLNFESKFEEAENNCGIIHYNSSHKPWLYPDEKYASLWWELAAQTPYHAEILKRLMQHCTTINNSMLYSLYILINLSKYKLKKRRYKIKYMLSWGKLRNKYHMKYKKVKMLIMQAEHLKQSWERSF